MNTPKTNFHSFELCEGQRRGSLLLYVPAEQQLYKFKSQHGHTRRYICYERYCKATATVDIRQSNNRLCRVALSEWHVFHPTQKRHRELLRLSSAIKKKSATPNLSRARLRRVYDAECRKDPESAEYLSFPKIQRQLLNIRNKAFPNDPQSSEEVSELFEDEDVMKKFGKSRVDTTASFYLSTVTESSFSYSVFLSPTIAELIDEVPLSESRRYHIDLRFKVPNCSYRNFLIIYFEFKEQVFPFIYVMMSDRNKAAYSHMFRHIESQGFKFFPHCFMYAEDDELEQSIETVFPNALSGVTWFHYCQAIRRRAKQIKYFPRVVRLNSNARTIFQKYLALPLVRMTRIKDAFNFLRSQINCNENLRADGEMFKAFIGYVQMHWIQKSVQFDTSLRAIRISSHLEVTNTRINKKLLQFNGFFKCVSFLLDEDDRTSVKFSEFVSRVRQPPSHPGPNDANYRIAHAASELDKGEISIEVFFKEVTKRKNDLQLILDEGFNDAERDDDIGYNDNIEEQPVLCIICSSGQRSVLLMPCMHIKLCEDCFNQIERQHLINLTETRCPLCRQIVTRTIKVFC